MIKYELTVKAGEYTAKDGSKKTIWQRVGEVHTSKDGGMYALIDAHINFAAFPRQDGATRVMVSMFEPREKSWSGASTTATPRPAHQQTQTSFDAGTDNENVPF